jgi:hypothetical protein
VQEQQEGNSCGRKQFVFHLEEFIDSKLAQQIKAEEALRDQNSAL